jgi:hypothetical protein
LASARATRVAERGDDAHRQHEQRKRHDGIGDAADDAVGPAAEIASRDTGKAAHQKHQRHRGHRDEGVEPSCHDDAAKNVAAELVGAEPVRRGRRLQCRNGIAGERIVGNHVGTEQRGKQDHDEQPEGKRGNAVFAEHIAGVLEHGGESRGPHRRGSNGFDRRRNATHASPSPFKSHPSSRTLGSITP